MSSPAAAAALAGGTAPPPASGPWWASRAEIDTSAPFESVKEAVDRFGGSGLWKTSAKQQQPQHHQMMPVHGMGLGMPTPPPPPPTPPLEMTHQACPEEGEESEDVPTVESVERQTALLEKDLAVKERQTLEVLKELEMTKRVLDGLKQRLQKHESVSAAAAAAAASAVNVPATPTKSSDSSKIHPISDAEEGAITPNSHRACPASPNGLQMATNSPPGSAASTTPSPGLILMELKQAKLNLTRTTTDLAGIRSSIDSVNSELQREKVSLETTRQRLSEKMTLVSKLEAELNQTRTVLQLIKEVGVGGLDGSSSPQVSRKLHELRSESEQFKRMAEAAGSEVSKLTAEIEKTKSGIKTVEVRMHAARKVEEAAHATEMAITAEIKAVMKSEGAIAAAAVAANDDSNPSYTVTLSVEEYNKLIQRAQEAEAESRKKIEAATAQLEEANSSKMDLMKKVDDAKAAVRMRKKTLSEALCRVEVANKGKLAVEEALRKWRSDGQRRRSSVHSSPRFKSSSHPAHHRRRNSKTPDQQHLVRTVDIIPTTTKSVLSPTLSIGQILSRKLMGPEDFSDEAAGGMILARVDDGPKISLGQMLSRRHGISSSESNGDDGMQHDGQFPVNSKKKKFAFVGFPLILAAKQERKSRKKKKRQQAWSPN